MPKLRIAVLLIIPVALIGDRMPDAAAQTCDDRYPMNCPLFIDPAAPTLQPSVRFGPRVILPPEVDEDPIAPAPPDRFGVRALPADPALLSRYAAVYARLDREPFPVPAVELAQIDPQFLRRTVSYPSNEPAGTLIIDPQNHFLYLIQEGGQAIRYGVGVGREGFGWAGTATVREKREWPDWYPPKEMVARQPELRRQLTELQSGVGMAGGARNPLGSRALYLWQGNKATLFRIHGTVEPWTIGRSVSSGCIRMINQDVIDLYQRTPIGAKVVVLGART